MRGDNETKCRCGKCQKCKAREYDHANMGHNLFEVPDEIKEKARKDYSDFLKDFHLRGEYSKEDFDTKRRLEALLR